MTSYLFTFTSDNLFHNDSYPLMELKKWTDCDDETILNDICDNFGKYFELAIECATDSRNKKFVFLDFKTKNNITKKKFVRRISKYYREKGLQELIDDLDNTDEYAFLRAGELDKLIEIIKTCAGKDHYMIC